MTKTKGKRRSGKASDFPKRKNKLGKGKRPPENATKVSFKSQSIVVPSQLTRSTQQPTGKRKLGLEALLRHLNHFKPSMRSDGLNGLRELFQDHPHLLVPNLAKLVGPVFSKLLDTDPSVRHSLRTLLSTMCTLVTPHHIHTHFSSIVAHLSCSLTHINDKIQLDSLKTFRILLDRYPSLLPAHAQHLLPLIASLISRHRGTMAGRGAGEKKQVSLVHDPHSKLSKWTSRIDVFTLLSQYLETIMECAASSGRELASLSSDHTSTPVTVDLEGKRVVVERAGEFVQVESRFCNFSGSIPCVMPLQEQGVPYKFEFTSTQAVALQSSTSAFSDVSKLVEFSETLLSLLLDCWLECGPHRSPRTSKDALVLTEAVVHLLYLTLKLAVFVDLSRPTANLQRAEKSMAALDSLKEKYSVSFLKHFMPSFPLRRTSSSSSAQIAQHLKMNLSLCHIATLLSGCSECSYESTVKSVCSFYGSLATVSANQQSLSSQLVLESSRIVSDTLPDLLAAVDGYCLPEASVDSLLGGVNGFYQSCHPQSSAKKCLIECFHRLLKASSVNSRVFTCFLLPWLETLPQLLVDLGRSSPALSAFIIDTLASTASYIPLTQLEQHMITLMGAEGVLSQLSSLSQRRFVELLWQVPSLSPRLLGVVVEWVGSVSGCADSSVAVYVVEAIHHKLLKTKDDSLSDADRVSQYLIFMLSLLLGNACTGDGKVAQPGSQCVTSPMVLTPCDRDVQYRRKFINVVCECVRSTYFSDQVLELTYPTLQTVLEVAISLPVDTALAVLYFLQSLSCVGSAIPQPLVHSLARLCYSVVLLAWKPQLSRGVAVDQCYQVTLKLLQSSRAVLVSLLQTFTSEIQKMSSEGGPVRDVAECFLSLLDSTELNSTLRKCSSVVRATAFTVSGALADAEHSLMVRINLSIKKFPLICKTS